MQIKILAEGGAMKPGPVLSQQLGPAGINIGDVISKVNVETASFAGITVPVTIDVDSKTKEITISVSSPPVSGLIKKELGVSKGSGAQAKLQVANASIEQIINVAKQKSSSLLCNNLKTSVKTVVGSCGSLGILIENKTAPEIEKDIDAGKYDKEINAGTTVCPEEKRAELDKYFNSIHAGQEKLMNQEKAAAAEEEVKKQEKAPEVKKK